MRNTLITFIFFAFTFYAKTCQCHPTASVKRAYKESGIIVKVTIIEILDPIDPVEIIITSTNDTLMKSPVFGYAKKVHINKTYKGKIRTETMIITGDNSTCELRLEKGNTYIIYGEIVNNQIVTSACTRSGNFNHHNDLAFLERKIRRK